MNERVRELCGVLEVESEHGTTVRVRVPVSAIPNKPKGEAEKVKEEVLIATASA
jgi:signal transduction histidine kinase